MMAYYYCEVYVINGCCLLFFPFHKKKQHLLEGKMYIYFLFI